MAKRKNTVIDWATCINWDRVNKLTPKETEMISDMFKKGEEANGNGNETGKN